MKKIFIIVNIVNEKKRCMCAVENYKRQIFFYYTENQNPFITQICAHAKNITNKILKFFLTV